MARNKERGANIRKIQEDIKKGENNAPRPANDGGIDDGLVNAGDKTPTRQGTSLV